jgi:hypothetical protein
MAKPRQIVKPPKSAPNSRDYSALLSQYASAKKDGDDTLADSIMAQIFMFSDLSQKINSSTHGS